MNGSGEASPRVYRPLVDTPGLFLEFASLVDEGEVTQDVWLDWVKCYGVLGLGHRYVLLGLGDEDAWFTEGYGITSGGPAETFKNFKREALRANLVLRLYEAAISQEGVDGEWLAAMEREIHELGGHVASFEPLPPVRLSEEAILSTIRLEIMRQVEECYPTLHLSSDAELVQGWGFHSLLGAMFLQMTWLTTAKDEQVRWCKRKGCNRIITFEQPAPPKEDPGFKKNARGRYKTRKDKAYCSDRCRASHYYHQKKPMGGR